MSPLARTRNLPEPRGRGGSNASRVGRSAEPTTMLIRAWALNLRRLRFPVRPTVDADKRVSDQTRT